MAVLTREQLWAELKRGGIAPVYLLFGEETYLRGKAARTIADIALAGTALREFNEVAYSLNDADGLAAALAAAEQLPMISERRVVRVDDVRVSSSGKRDTLKEDDEPRLASYISRPCPSSVVIFVADDLDRRRKLAKILLDKAVAVSFEHLNDAELANWARREISARGADIDERALHYFVGLVGNDMQRLETEIGKITTAALPQKLVTFDIVDTIVPSTRVLENFDLTNQLFSRDRVRTFETLKKILDDGAEPLMLLGLLATSYRRLLKAKEMMASGVDRREVAATLSVPYRMQEEVMTLARRSDTQSLKAAIERIAETDLAIKTSRGGSGSAGARLQIEILVARLVAL